MAKVKQKPAYYESTFTPSNRKALQFCEYVNNYHMKVIRAHNDAEILSTEYCVCAGLGFIKYLN